MIASVGHDGNSTAQQCARINATCCMTNHSCILACARPRQLARLLLALQAPTALLKKREMEGVKETHVAHDSAFSSASSIPTSFELGYDDIHSERILGFLTCEAGLSHRIFVNVRRVGPGLGSKV